MEENKETINENKKMTELFRTDKQIRIVLHLETEKIKMRTLDNAERINQSYAFREATREQMYSAHIANLEMYLKMIQKEVEMCIDKLKLAQKED